MALWQDLRHGVRLLLKHPGFTVVAVLILALGTGMNTAVFALINGMLLRPIPVPDADRLIRFSSTTAGAPARKLFPYPHYQEYRDNNPVFSDVVATAQVPVSVTFDKVTEQVLGEIVSGDYFSGIGVRVTNGRALLPGDDRAGADPVVVIGDALSKRAFTDGSPAIGAALNVNGKAYTIVGVAPPTYTGIAAGFGIDVWVPLNQAASWVGPDTLTDRDTGKVEIVGRLRAGVTLSAAQAAMAARAKQIEAAFPDASQGRSVLLERARYLDNSLRRPIAGFLTILLALAGLVLAIVCINIANLLLVRMVGRRREIAMRRALGASRARVGRQVMTESVLLGLAGGIAGLVLGSWSAGLVPKLNPLPDSIPLHFDFPVDFRTLAFGFLASLLTGVLVGVASASQAARTEVLTGIKEGGGSLGGSQKSRMRDVFVVAQLAVSLMLLIGAGLFMRSLWNARSIDLGFSPQNALATDLDLKLKRFTDDAGKQFYRETLRRMEALPGVRSATLANLAPLDTATPLVDFMVAGYQVPRDRPRLRASFNRIGPRYFETMGIRLVEGREIDERDDATRPGVAVINETMARRFWPGESPIGKQFAWVRGKQAAKSVQVVGVARDLKYRSLGEDPEPHIYVSFLQDYTAGMTLLVRTAADPGSALVMVQRELSNQDPDVHGFFSRTLVQHIGLAFLPARLAAGASAAFGVFALLLAILGVYGVISYSASRRTREIGLRMALGAQRSDVLKLILRQGTTLIAVGLALGLTGALALTRFLRSFLYGIGPDDPLTFSSVAVVLAAIAFASCYLPARRAARIDPIVALRYE